MHKTLNLNASCSSTGLKASYTLKANYKYIIKKPASNKIVAWNDLEFFIDDGAGNRLNYIAYAGMGDANLVLPAIDELIILGDGSKRLCIYFIHNATTQTVNTTIPFEEIYL